MVGLNQDSDETPKLFRRLTYGEIRGHGLEMYAGTVCAFGKGDEENVTRLIKYSNTALKLNAVHQL